MKQNKTYTYDDPYGIGIKIKKGEQVVIVEELPKHFTYNLIIESVSTGNRIESRIDDLTPFEEKQEVITPEEDIVVDFDNVVKDLEESSNVRDVLLRFWDFLDEKGIAKRGLYRDDEQEEIVDEFLETPKEVNPFLIY